MEEQRTKKQTNKNRKNIENKYQNGQCKPNHIKNYIKCKWASCFNQNVEIVRLDKKYDFPVCDLQTCTIFKDTSRLKREKYILYKQFP